MGDFTLAANAPTTATVSSGGTGTFNLMVTPLGLITTFPAAIALTATDGPAGATYVFAPASVASGSAAAKVTLTVTLPAQNAAAATGLRWPDIPVPLVFAALLPFARRGKRGGAGWGGAALLLSVGGLWIALALSGCGNSFYTRKKAPGPPIPTTPQTYTITITGASGGLDHSVWSRLSRTGTKSV